jgi:hypothetical protein
MPEPPPEFQRAFEAAKAWLGPELAKLSPDELGQIAAKLREAIEGDTVPEDYEKDLLRRLGCPVDLDNPRELWLQRWAAARVAGISDAEFWGLTQRELCAMLEYRAPVKGVIPARTVTAATVAETATATTAATDGGTAALDGGTKAESRSSETGQSTVALGTAGQLTVTPAGGRDKGNITPAPRKILPTKPAAQERVVPTSNSKTDKGNREILTTDGQLKRAVTLDVARRFGGVSARAIQDAARNGKLVTEGTRLQRRVLVESLLRYFPPEK